MPAVNALKREITQETPGVRAWVGAVCSCAGLHTRACRPGGDGCDIGMPRSCHRCPVRCSRCQMRLIPALPLPMRPRPQMEELVIETVVGATTKTTHLALVIGGSAACRCQPPCHGFAACRQQHRSGGGLCSCCSCGWSGPPTACFEG
jgi:hypothetical protein